MFQIPKKLNSFNGLGWGQAATLDIDTGAVFHEILLQSGTLTPADIEWVTLTLNGDDIIKLKGIDLLMLERYRKRYVTSGLVVLYLSDIMNEGLQARNVSSLVTFPTDQLTLKVDIAAGSGAIDLKASAQVSASQPERIVIPRKFRQNIQAGQTANNEWTKLQRGPAIQRIHLEGDVGRVKWKKDGYTAWERDADVNTAMLKRMDRAPQPGYFHFDAIESDFGLADLFGTVVNESLVMEYDIGTPGNLPMIVESIQAVATSNTQSATA